MGTGTRDIVDKCRAIGLKAPEFIQEEDFKVILWRKELVDEGVNEGVNKSEQFENKIDKIYALIREGVNEGINEGINELLGILMNSAGLNAVELAVKMNKSDATIERYLRTLREKEIVEFRGASKTGGYYFTEKVNRILNE
jgi:ATP-dependent DNA helicase RecG